MFVYILLLVLFLSVAVAVLSLILFLRGSKNRVTERLEQMKAPSPRLSNKPEMPLRFKRAVEFVAAKFPQPSEKKISRYRTLLLQAGFRKEESVKFIYGLKLIATVALPVSFLIFGSRFFDLTMGIVITALLAFFGFFAVDGYLSARVRKRQEELFRNLPDVLDLLAIVVEAGMGLDSAIRRVSEEQIFSKKPLAVELQLVVSEISVGLPRVEALRNLYRRTGLEDIKAFTDMVIQSEKFGTRVSLALKAFSESLRTRRMQLAEELAAKTTIKLVFPLVFFIFPAIFIVLLGPAVITIMKSF